MRLRDVHAQVHNSLEIKVVVSTAKAHSERGQVEHKIRSLRESLEKMGVNINHPQTVLQWETFFSKIANTVDILPFKVLAQSSKFFTLQMGSETDTVSISSAGPSCCPWSCSSGFCGPCCVLPPKSSMPCSVFTILSSTSEMIQGEQGSSCSVLHSVLL